MNYKYTLTTGGVRSEIFFNVYSVYTINIYTIIPTMIYH